MVRATTLQLFRLFRQMYTTSGRGEHVFVASVLQASWIVRPDGCNGGGAQSAYAFRKAKRYCLWEGESPGPRLIGTNVFYGSFCTHKVIYLRASGPFLSLTNSQSFQSGFPYLILQSQLVFALLFFFFTTASLIPFSIHHGEFVG